MCIRVSAILLLAFSCSVFFTSCEEPAPDLGPSLIGRWEIVKGYRNDKQTETLTGTYFEFDAAGSMVTNLPVGPETKVNYELNKDVIRQECTPPVEYKIQDLNDSTLVLGLELRGMQFTMHFLRAPELPPAPPEPDSLQQTTMEGDSTLTTDSLSVEE